MTLFNLLHHWLLLCNPHILYMTHNLWHFLVDLCCALDSSMCMYLPASATLKVWYVFISFHRKMQLNMTGCTTQIPIHSNMKHLSLTISKGLFYAQGQKEFKLSCFSFFASKRSQWKEMLYPRLQKQISILIPQAIYHQLWQSLSKNPAATSLPFHYSNTPRWAVCKFSIWKTQVYSEFSC